jgi:hypothetical protein
VTTYAILGLAAALLVAGWHVAIRYAPARPTGAHEAGHPRSQPDPDLAGALETVRVLGLALDRAQHTDGARAALLLRELVRSRDELTMSRPTLDLLDDAAAFLRETMNPSADLTDREVGRLAEMLAEPVTVAFGMTGNSQWHGEAPRAWWPPSPTAADDARFWPTGDAYVERHATEPTANEGDVCTGSCIDGDCDCPNREPDSPTVVIRDAGVIKNPDLCPLCGAAWNGHDRGACDAKMAAWKPTGFFPAGTRVMTESEVAEVAEAIRTETAKVKAAGVPDQPIEGE